MASEARYFIINNNLQSACEIYVLDGPTHVETSRRSLVKIPAGKVHHFDLSALSDLKLELLHKVQAHVVSSAGGGAIDLTVLQFNPTSNKQARYHVNGTAEKPVITFKQLEDAHW
ncbi:hypothetical protein BDP27DRAFT_1366331 [Rhodocollybia butyracea]|uniref:Uncharacterized protein n=1 Tax=Rhodocollybia butyracea TaxID=206335 RepID=A0A9P5PPA9_9AGAR|nr:hypothetical protein BDP27DRAFT_1366331 [Rhodocollybia butyracea]